MVINQGFKVIQLSFILNERPLRLIFVERLKITTLSILACQHVKLSEFYPKIGTMLLLLLDSNAAESFTLSCLIN